MKLSFLKVILFALVVTLCIVFFVFDLGDYLSLSYLKEQKAVFRRYYEDRPVLTGFVFGLIYVVVTGLSLPGAAILTLLAGALFGLVVGTLIVSFASTMGATLACVFSRSLLRDFVQKKFGDKL